MKTNVVCYDEDTLVQAIYDFLCRVTIRRVVIVKDGVPRGVISRGSLLQWFSNWVKTCVHPQPSTSQQDSTQALARLAAELADRANRLRTELAEGCDDPPSAVIGSVTQMQAVLGDLLLQTRQCDNHRGAVNAAQLADCSASVNAGLTDSNGGLSYD
jgi:hypothetical protein